MFRLSGALRVLAATLTCVLASCGGGGGGGGGSDSDGDAGGVSVTSSASAFQLFSVVPNPAASAAVTFTLSGGNGQTFYANAVSDMPNLQATVDVVSDTQAIVTLTEQSTASTAGTTSGSVVFELCSDQNCQHVVWSHSYAVSSTHFKIDTTALTVSGHEGATTTSSLTVTPPDTMHLLALVEIGANGSDGPWLAATHDGAGNIALTLSAATLSAGSYSGYLAVGTPGDESAALVNVEFNVGAGIAAPAFGDLVERLDSPAAALPGSATLAFSGSSGAWTATSDTAWLVIDTPSGSGPGTVSYHVDLAAADAVVSNWAAATANVSFASPGKTTVSSTLTYRRQLPEVSLVTPSQIWPGQASKVRVTGRGLSQLSSVAGIQVGNQPAAAGTIDSDSQATLQLPAQAAGSLQVSIPNAVHANGVRANLAVAAGRLPYAAIPTSNSKNDIVYDPSRQAIFATDNVGQVLSRWQWVGGTWSVSSQPWANIWRVALSADRQTLYVLTQASLFEVDPDTLAVRATHDGAFFDGFAYDEPIPFTLDQRLWMPEAAGRYFDLRTHAFANASAAAVTGTGGFNTLEATPDGTHLFTANAGSPNSFNGWYVAATQTGTALPVGLLQDEYNAVFDLDGGMGLFEWQWVYRTDTWALVGTAALPAGEAGVGGAISPDGTRVYRLAGPSYSDAYRSDHIDVFDTTQLQPGTSQFVQIGTIPVPDDAVGCSGYYCDIIGRIAIDPLGSTLFWAGDKYIVVIPIPQQMAQPSSVKPGARHLQAAKVSAVSRR